MIPISDDNTTRRTLPVVTYILIVLNFLFFFAELAGGEEFIMKWAFIPSKFLQNPLDNLPTLFSSMFMHAGWAHLLGNMLYLWIFGDNVEDRLGKLPFLLFYIVCGLAATFSQMAFNSTSSVPNLGASGAIAGVLGSYMLLFPQSKVNVLVGRSMTQMSALIVIGFWFLLQFFSGMSSVVSSGNDTGGVAYLAHIGGFIAGVIITLFYKAVAPAKP